MKSLNEMKASSSIVTYTGVRYYPFAPRVGDVRIEDIAHSLSLQCRYAGHSSVFYSVAEHSMMVSTMVPPGYRLEALLHDAAEAYCQDLCAPVKNYLPDYVEMITNNERVVREAFGLPAEESACVNFVDVLVGRYERIVLTSHWSTPDKALEMDRIRDDWQLFATECETIIPSFPLTHHRSTKMIEEDFLNRYRQLKAGYRR